MIRGRCRYPLKKPCACVDVSVLPFGFERGGALIERKLLE